MAILKLIAVEALVEARQSIGAGVVDPWNET